jgi:L-fucose mutarotase/ribose pyranase (RbsD/FucU family)
LGNSVLKIISPRGHFSTLVNADQEYPFISVSEISKVKEEILVSELDKETKEAVLCALEGCKVVLLSDRGYVLFNGLTEKGFNDFQELVQLAKVDNCEIKKKVEKVEALQVEEITERRVIMFSMEECFSKLISFASTLNSAIERRDNLKERILEKIAMIEVLSAEVKELKAFYEKIATDVEDLQQKYEDQGLKEEIERLLYTNSFTSLSNLVQEEEGDQSNE